MTQRMRAGALKRFVLVQQRSAAQDDYGAQVETWADLKSIYVSIEPMTVNELSRAAAYYPEITHKITARYDATLFADPAITAALRIKYGTRNFNIHGAMNMLEEDSQIELMASEGLNQG